MKLNRCLRESALWAALFCLSASSASSATLYWDRNGASSGAGLTPNGTWDLATTANWNLDPLGAGAALVGWTAGDTAVFSAGTDATLEFNVNVAANQTAAALVVEEGHVALSGSGINVGSGTVTVATGAKLTITNFYGTADRSIVGNAGARVQLNGSTLRNATDEAGVFLDPDFSIELGPLGGTVETSAVAIFSGRILGPGVTLTKSGPVYFRYDGVNTQTATFSKLVVNQGSYRLGSVVIGGVQQTAETGFGAVPAVFTPDAITLDGGACIGSDFNLTLHANRGITLGPGGGGVETGEDSITIPGRITGPGSFTKTHLGATSYGVTLTGDNDYTGTTFVNTGFISIGHANALGSATAGTQIAVDAEVRVTGAGNDFTTNEPFQISGSGTSRFPSGGALVILEGATPTFAGIITLVADAAIAASSAAKPAFTAPIVAADGDPTLTLQGDSNVPALISGPIATGGGGLIKSGSGHWRLSGSNSYTGGTGVVSGILQFMTREALYGGVPAKWTPENITVGYQGTLAVNVGGPGEFTAADLDIISALGSLTGGFFYKATLGIDTTNAAGGTFTYATAIADHNGGVTPFGLTKLGTGTLVLNGANTYTEPTTVLAGTLALGSTGSIADASYLTVNGATAVFALGTNHNETVGAVGLENGAITGSGTSALTSSGTLASFALVEGTVSVILAGANVPLIKLRPGTVTLSAANTYTGATSISIGTLLVTGSLSGTSGVSIIESGNLGGTGTIAPAAGGDITLSSGRISPGTGVGTLTVILSGVGAEVNLTPGVGSANSQALVFDLDTPFVSDKVVITGGTLTIGAGLLEYDDFAFTLSAGFGIGDYVLFDGSSPIIGHLGQNLSGVLGGFAAQLQTADAGNDLILHVVPEPATATLFLAGLALLAARPRRHASHACSASARTAQDSSACGACGSRNKTFHADQSSWLLHVRWSDLLAGLPSTCREAYVRAIRRSFLQVCVKEIHGLFDGFGPFFDPVRRAVTFAFDDDSLCGRPGCPNLLGHVDRVLGRHQIILAAVEEQKRWRRA